MLVMVVLDLVVHLVIMHLSQTEEVEAVVLEVVMRVVVLVVLVLSSLDFLTIILQPLLVELHLLLHQLEVIQF